MPAAERGYIRESRKKMVLMAFYRGRHMTAAEIAAFCGWPVNRITKLLTCLVAEQRLREVGSKVQTYVKSRERFKGDTTAKEVKIYGPVPGIDPMALPAWLRGPGK
jgi:hypothetical protein